MAVLSSTIAKYPLWSFKIKLKLMELNAIAYAVLQFL
jgi:hypothetical protein